MTTRSVIYGQDEVLVPWAAKRIGVPFDATARAIGLVQDGELRAVVVYDRFSEVDCCMHIASDGTRRWMSREYLVKVFAYPFVQLGLRRVTGLVAAKNADAMRFDLNIGFKIEGRMRQAMPDDDLMVLGMLREECRFLYPPYTGASPLN